MSVQTNNREKDRPTFVGLQIQVELLKWKAVCLRTRTPAEKLGLLVIKYLKQMNFQENQITLTQTKVNQKMYFLLISLS